MAKQLYDFKATKITETDKAILLDVEDKEVWFPSAVVEDNKDGTYTVPMSWAIEKEIV